MTSRRQVLFAAGAALLAGPPAAAQPAASPHQALGALLDRFFEENLGESPETVTSLGLDTGARAAAKAKLHDGSVAGLDRRKSLTADQLRRLRALDRSPLNGMDAVNYDTVLFDLETTDAAGRRFAYGDQGAGNPYVLSQINGAYQEVPDFLDSQHTIEARADAEAYVARLAAFGRLMDEETERVRRDVGLGVVPPDFALKAAIGQMKTLNVGTEASTLVASVADRAKAKGIAGDWRGQAGRVYAEKVRPAIARQQALLESLLPKAAHDAGVWRLPDGEAYYAAALTANTTTKLTPDEIHKMGLDVTAELSARADVLFKKLGMTQGSVGQRYDGLYKRKVGIVPDTDAAKAKLVADLNGLVRRIEARMPEQFGTLPKAKLEIRRIPKATEQGSSTHYSSGSIDGSRPGIYWINLRDTAESPFWWMPTTTFHEGVPGHHHQQSLQREADLPMIRRAGGFNAYNEGWALYAEQVVQEMGFYKDEPLWELGYIHDALLRSGRLVVDTGLHHLRWSREKAIQTLSDIDGDPISLSTQEIERYAVWPGQACGYMVGKVEILRLRDKARAALGPRFDPRKFHDALLLSGSMPLTVLDRVVDDHIASRKA